MGRVKEMLFDAEDAEHAAWEASAEGRESAARVRREAAARNVEEAAAVARREKAWAAQKPAEWREWQRVRLLLLAPIAFGDDDFDFGEFLKEVGRAPSPRHSIRRNREDAPYQPGNLCWVGAQQEAPASPHMTARESAAYLRIAYSTFRGRARFIKRAPQTKTFRREDLDDYASKQKCRRIR